MAGTPRSIDARTLAQVFSFSRFSSFAVQRRFAKVDQCLESGAEGVTLESPQ